MRWVIPLNTLFFVLMASAWSGRVYASSKVCYMSYDTGKQECVTDLKLSKNAAHFCQHFVSKTKKWICLSAKRYYESCHKKFKQNTAQHSICMTSGGKMEFECHRVVVMDCHKVYKAMSQIRALCRAMTKSTSCELEREIWKKHKSKHPRSSKRQAAKRKLLKCRTSYVNRCVKLSLSRPLKYLDFKGNARQVHETGKRFVERWRKSWELTAVHNHAKMLAKFYHSRYYDAKKRRNRRKFIRYKSLVAKKLRWIKVNVTRVNVGWIHKAKKRIKITFTQQYECRTLFDLGQKTLFLAKDTDGSWRIYRESWKRIPEAEFRARFAKTWRKNKTKKHSWNNHKGQIGTTLTVVMAGRRIPQKHAQHQVKSAFLPSNKSAGF